MIALTSSISIYTEALLAAFFGNTTSSEDSSSDSLTTGFLAGINALVAALTDLTAYSS